MLLSSVKFWFNFAAERGFENGYLPGSKHRLSS